LGIAILSIAKRALTTTSAIYQDFSSDERQRPELSLMLLSSLVNSQRHADAITFASTLHAAPSWTIDQALQLDVLKGTALRPIDIAAALDLHEAALQRAEAQPLVQARTRYYCVVAFLGSALTQGQPASTDPAVNARRHATVARLTSQYASIPNATDDKFLRMQWHMLMSAHYYKAGFESLSLPPTPGIGVRDRTDLHFAKAEEHCAALESIGRTMPGTVGIERIAMKVAMARGRMALVRQQWTIALQHVETAVAYSAHPRDGIDAYMLYGDYAITRCVALANKDVPLATQLSEQSADYYAIALGIALRYRLTEKASQARLQSSQATDVWNQIRQK